MAGKSGAIVPLWLKQAEEQKVKEEQEKAAAAKAAFEATFKDAAEGSHFSGNGDAEGAESLSESESEGEKTVGKPIGPVDPSKCTATGAGVGGGAAGAAISFVVIARDSDGRKLPSGGALIRAKINSIGSGGSSSSDQEALTKDNADGTYTVTYVVAKRGDYMVSVTCNGCPIDGSPFPVFFGGGGSGSGIGGNSNTLNAGLLPSPNPLLASAPLTNGVNQSSSVQIAPGLPPGFLGMIPGMLPGATGGVILPGRAAAFGEVCRDYLNGCCGKTDCKFNHPPQAQLMGALASGTAMAGLSNMPMAPSAAAMAAAQSIIAAQAYQAKIAAQQHDKPGQQPPPLPMMMQQAIAAQQLQFQQALLMQQAFASQQAAVRTATIKSAAEMAAARAAEISKSLKADGDDNDGKETAEKSKSPLRLHARSKSRSPIKYRSDRRSRSMSRSPVRYHRSQRVRSISRDRYRRRSPPFRDSYSRHSSSHHYSRHGREREKAREYDHHRPKRSRSRSRSRGRKRSRSVSPRHRRDRSRSPRGGRREEKRSERHSRHSRSNSREPKRSAVSTTKSSDGSKGGSSRKESKTYHGDVKHSDRSHNDQGYNVEGGSEASKVPSNHRHVGKRSGEKQYSHQIIAKIKELAEDPEIVSPGVNLKEQVDHTGRKQNEGDQEGEDLRELDDWRNDLNVQEENSRSRDKNRDKRKDRTRATEKTSKERDHKDYDRNTEKTSRDRDNKDYDKYKESLEQAA